MTSTATSQATLGPDQGEVIEAHGNRLGMTDRAIRALVAICGITGVLMLTAHFLIPANVPSDSASSRMIKRETRDRRFRVRAPTVDETRIRPRAGIGAEGLRSCLRPVAQDARDSRSAGLSWSFIRA